MKHQIYFNIILTNIDLNVFMIENDNRYLCYTFNLKVKI